ncbi:MAG: dihydrodipicolinate synthase family protein, partial [Verrucomicrobia bacterium]
MAEPQTNWKGVFPAVTTQFKPDQSLDLDAMARHIEVLIGSGVQGLVMLGSLGENTALDPEEKREVMRMAVRLGQG